MKQYCDGGEAILEAFRNLDLDRKESRMEFGIFHALPCEHL